MVNILEALIDFFASLGKKKGDRETRNSLREIEKRLRSSREYFSPKKKVLLGDFAQKFYSIYELTFELDESLGAILRSQEFKTILIESFFEEEETALLEQIDYDRTYKKCQEKPIDVVAKEIDECLGQLEGFFTPEKRGEINNMYDALHRVSDILSFDYYALLKKFDFKLPQNDSRYRPTFEPVGGDFLLDNLKDFDYLLGSINLKTDWEHLFKAVNIYRNQGVLNYESWKVILSVLKAFKKTKILWNLIAYIEESPHYKAASVEPGNYDLTDDYIGKLEKEARKPLAAIEQDRRRSYRDGLLVGLFGTANVNSLKYYTCEQREALIQHSLSCFFYIEPLNYLATFMNNFFIGGGIQSVVMRILVTGQWVNIKDSEAFSEAFYQLQTIPKQITQFDNVVSPNGEVGEKIERFLRTVVKSKNAATSLNIIFRRLDQKAHELVEVASGHLSVVNKNIKLCIEDYAKEPKSELVGNWKAIAELGEKPLEEELDFACEKIDLFLQLIEYYLKHNLMKLPHGVEATV